MIAIDRSYVDLGWGQLHVVSCGPETAPAVICLHQTPRSWDEFREVLPVLGQSYRVYAFDLPGMGSSDRHPDGHTIEGYAKGVLAGAARLGISKAHLLGHHTGGVVAIEIAVRAPSLVASLTLSSTPYVDADERRQRGRKRSIDDIDMLPHGEHLTDLWNRRAPYYPADRPDLLQRFVADAIRAPGSHEGHAAVGRYEMEARLPLVEAPVLLIGHQRDPFAFPQFDRLSEALEALGRPHKRVVLPEGTIPLEASAQAVTASIHAFISQLTT